MDFRGWVKDILILFVLLYIFVSFESIINIVSQISRTQLKFIIALTDHTLYILDIN